MFNNINQELERAVQEQNLEKLKALVSAGANINYKPEKYNDNKNSLLHISNSAEITKELLFCGADVNANNKYRETPLHSAITCVSNLKLVRELLKHGAEVNSTTCKGNTALDLAVRNSFMNLNVIKDLLEHGGDINLSHDNSKHHTSLGNAMAYLDVTKLLIRITLIKNFHKSYERIIDLDPYIKWRSYSEISSYQKKCVDEIYRMESELTEDGPSLYECVTDNFSRPVIGNNTCVKLAQIDYSIYYPIYKGYLIDTFRERANLLNKLDNIQMFTNCKEKQIAFDVCKKHGTDAFSFHNLVEVSASSDAKH